jgi:hypothetical protein
MEGRSWEIFGSRAKILDVFFIHALLLDVSIVNDLAIEQLCHTL